MAKEIERKFLVNDLSFKDMATESESIMQVYLSAWPHPTVRVRTAGGRAWITVKSATHGCERQEWEYAIPVADAVEMAALAVLPPLTKTRWRVPFAGLVWEVDEFHGVHQGLVVAEVELPSADVNPELPPFVGREVTGDRAYYNSTLAGQEG